MKILVTGARSNGSWKIRGEQLGAAIGARVVLNPVVIANFDVAVVVKRAPDKLLSVISGHPKIWDIVDAWPQPVGNSWDRDQAMDWLRFEIARIQPDAIVAATNKMAEDCAEFGVPVICIPHHARVGQEVNPIRRQVQAIGYEGSEQHLGRWRGIASKMASARGWKFLINPSSLAELDIVLALRDAQGYPAANWKSNVKLANAQATGTPCVLSFERGYIETQSGAEFWAENEAGLTTALDRLQDYSLRAQTSRTLQSATPYLPAVAHKYRTWLQQLRF